MILKRQTGGLFLAALCGIALCVSVAGAYSGPEHAWLGLRSFGFWQNFDPDFYHELTKSVNTPAEAYEQVMLQKFYLIGCMVPDLFEPMGMHLSRSVVKDLYGVRSLIGTDPFLILPATDSQVSDTFAWHCPRPNDNLPVLWNMVQYAKNHSWDVCYKSMVYGAYAHVVMDLAAGCYQQPTLWGYGLLADPPGAESLFDVLANAELHAEYFEPTFIQAQEGPSWTDVDNILFSGLMWEGGVGPVAMQPAPATFFRSYRLDGEYYEGWQTIPFYAIDSFVSLANRYFAVDSLTPARLQAYLHGFGIYNFLMCGYTQHNTGEAGGIYRHADWKFSDILSYMMNIGEPGPIPFDQWSIGGLDDLPRWLIKKIIFQGMFVPELLAEQAVFVWLPDLALQREWPRYLENEDDLLTFRNAIQAVYDVRGETLPGWVSKWYDRSWSYLAKWRLSFRPAGDSGPWQQSYYSGEPAVALNLLPEMKKNVEQGPTYLSHQLDYPFQSGVQARTIARKAGLTGGMYQAYGHDRQPGIVNMCFLRDNVLVYDSAGVPAEGDPVTAELFYDLLPFGTTLKLSVMAVTTSGDVELVSETLSVAPFSRISGIVQFDMREAVQMGAECIGFVVKTPDSCGNYGDMLCSNYHSAYSSNQDFWDNTLYQDWLNTGIPTRTAAQNPLTNPKQYWPYILKLDSTPGYFVASPTAASAASTPEGIHLAWQNRSQCADRVVILRSVGGGGFARYDSVGPDTSEYLDADVDCGHSYHYQVVAYHAETGSELSNTTSAAFDERWEHRSDFPLGGRSRRVRDGGALAGMPGTTDEYVYALKGGNTNEFYRYSVGNHFWQACESVPVVQVNKRVFRGAALVAGTDARLYALKGDHTREFWRYDPSLSGGSTYPWQQMSDMPFTGSRTVCDGGALAEVTLNDICYIYALKGSNSREFYRFNTASEAWETMTAAPQGPRGKTFKSGSCLVSDGSDVLYALKGGTAEFYSYNVGQNAWTTGESIPRRGQSGKSKVAKYGSALTYAQGQVYALKGNGTNDFFLYSPSQGEWDIVAGLPACPGAKGVRGGGALTTAAGHVWALRGNNTRDFWRYTTGDEEGMPAGSEEPEPGENEILVASATGAASPRWSPNGTFIVYTAPDANGRDQVFAAHVNDTLSPVPITNIQGQCAFPSFAPDANHIVFQYQLDTAGYSRIGVAALQGGSTVTVGRSAADCRNPEWSYSGQQIYFESDDGNGYSQLWSASAQGGTPTQLTSSAMNHELPKALSSTELVFQGEDGNGFGQIYRLVINTGTVVQLTSSSADHESPSVAQSPRIVAYVVTNPAGYQQIAKVSANGGPETWLTSGQADHTAPSITGDGLTIECTRSNVGSNSICEVDVLTASTTERTDDCAGRESPDSRVTNSTPRWVSAAYARSDGIYRTVNGGGGEMGNAGPIVSFDWLGPNPSTGRSMLFWSLRAPTRVQIQLFDIAGRSVRTFVDGTALAGSYRTQLDTRRVAHGVYVLRIKAGDYRKSYKLVLE